MKKNRKQASRGGVFIRNAAILSATSLLLKAAGMYFRIYISGLLGAEGMGLYQMIMSVYVLLSGFASSGIVVAVTRMTADEMACGTEKSVKLVLRRCLMLSFAMGMFSAAAAFSLAQPIGVGWISDARAVSSVRVISLALPFMSISCCLRGYFTARRRAAVPAAAQIAEQTTRIILAVIMLHKVAGLGVERSCLAIMASDAISEGAGCAFVAAAYFIDRRKPPITCGAESKNEGKSIWRRIWEITLPITASYYLTSLLRTVESILVPDCLTKYEGSRTRALELFGLVKGMALPLILFPSTVLTAFSSLLVPEISEAAALGQRGRVDAAVRRTMHITLTLSLPVGALFLAYPAEIGTLVYGEPQLEVILRWLAPLMPLMYTESVAMGILRGLGEQNSSLRYGVADSVIRLVLIITAVPRCGLYGFLAVMTVSNLLTPALHVFRMHRVTGVPFEFGRWLLEPTAAAAISFGGARLLLSRAALPDAVAVCAGGGLSMLAYFGLLMLFGSVTAEEIRSLLPVKNTAVPKKCCTSGKSIV